MPVSSKKQSRNAILIKWDWFFSCPLWWNQAVALHFLLWKSLIGVPLPLQESVRLSVFSTSNLRNQDLFLFNTYWHTNPRVSSRDLMYYLALLSSGRQCLAFNSSRKSRGVFSLSSYPNSPFCCSDISVLRPKYCTGHVQTSKSSGTQRHSDWERLNSYESYWKNVKKKKKGKIPLDSLVLVCLFRSFHKLLLPPAFQQSCCSTARKSSVSHQTLDTCPTTAACEINCISHKSRVWFAQTGCKILHNSVV